MKLFHRTQPSQPARRQVSVIGRTNAFSYHARRSEESAALGRQMLRRAIAARASKREGRPLLRWLGTSLFGLVLLGGAIVLLSLSTNPQVVPVDAAHAEFLHPLATYQQAAAAYLDGSPLNHNKLTVDASGLSMALKRQFPELAVVSLRPPFLGMQPTVYIAPAEPVLALLATDGRTYIIDTAGRAVGAVTPARAAALHLMPTKDVSGTPIHVGQLALSSDTVMFIRTVSYQMSQKQLTVTSFVLPATSSELDMYLAGQAYYVKFNLADDSAAQQSGTYLAARRYLQSRGITPVEYVDVRIAGRAYYK